MSKHRFNTPSPVRLDVKIAAGDVHVETVDGDESLVVLTGPEKLVETMRVELLGDRLVIDERRKGLLSVIASLNESLNVHVQLPRASSVEVATASAGARLEGSFDSVDMRSASGDLEVAGEVSGDVKVKTASGSARLPRVGGKLDVKTVSGDVDVDTAGRVVSGKSVSGDFDIGSVREGKVEVHSVSGDVVVGVEVGTSIDVDASSASGDLSSEIPLSSDAPAGDGGPTVAIRVQTVSGDLLVRRAGLVEQPSA